MSTQREQYERWIREYLEPHHPELLPQFLKAVEGFDGAVGSGVLTNEQLAPIVEAACSPRTPLGENVAGLLGQLATQFPAAERAVRELAAHPKVHARINALVSISSTSPTQFHDDVLRIALKDRSTKVRALAADKMMQFGLDHLLPDLESAIALEDTEKVRDALEFSRDLLRDGYRLRTHETEVYG